MEEMRKALEAAQRLIQDLQTELLVKEQRIVELEDCISAMSSKENLLASNAADPPEQLSPKKMKKLSLPDNTDSVVCTKSAPNTLIREQPSLPLPQPSEDLIASPNRSFESRSLHGRHAKSSIDLMTMKLNEGKQASLKTTTLGQRLAMTARQRRQVAQTNRSRSPATTAAASRSTGNLQPAPENNRLAQTMPLQPAPGKPSVDRLSSTLCVEDPRFRLPSMALLIAHDNPQLGKTIRNMVLKQGSVLCMLESHNGKGSSHFLLGDIVFSGDFEAVEHSSYAEQRGSGCIVLSQLYLAVADTKSLQQRPGLQDIMEIELPFASRSCDDLEALENFWKPCRSRVDVILDPYHSNKRWFPYFEGRRKMAPQFRSKGVGYLRLGDDMSNFGTAFLSADGGQTYLDNGACNAMQKPSSLAIVSTASPLPLGRTKSIRQLVETSRSNSINEVRDGEEEDEEEVATVFPVDATALEAAFDAVSQGETVDQVLLDLSQQMDRLREEHSKWTDRQVALQILQQTLSKLGERKGLEDLVLKTNSSCGLFSDLFLWLSDCFTRVSHISVLTAALRLVEVFAPLRALPASPTLALAWKALVAEALYLLRSGNRNVAEAASQTLLTLHRGGALPLPHIVETIDDILNGHSSSDKKKAKVVSNTHKVLAWLQSVLLVERSQSTLEVPSTILTSHQLFCLLKSVKVLLTHREEPSREAAVNTLALIVSIEVIQMNQQGSRSSSPTDSQPSSPTNSLSTKISMWKSILEQANTSEEKTALWQEMLEGNCTESTKAIVKEIIETAAKVGGKILSALCATLSAWVEPQRSSALSVSAGVKSLKRRLSSHCKLKTAASPSALQTQLPNEQSQSQSSHRDAQQGNSRDHLASLWYETKLLLKVCPTGQDHWETVMQAVQGAPACFSGLMAIAEERQISVGSLIRKVLPFDENTSSADQAASAALHLERIAQEDPPVANLAKQIAYIRGTLRVKIADEADFAQARLAIATLSKHLEQLKCASDSRSMTLHDLISSLEVP
eukprot:gene6625-7318_t